MLPKLKTVKSLRKKIFLKSKFTYNNFDKRLFNYNLLIRKLNERKIKLRSKTFVSAFKTLVYSKKKNLSLLKNYFLKRNFIKNNFFQKFYLKNKSKVSFLNKILIGKEKTKLKKKKKFFFFIDKLNNYLFNLTGNLSFHTYPTGNYISKILRRCKNIFPEYKKYFYIKSILIKKREKRYKRKGNEYDILPLVNLLKVKQKFQYITKSFVKGCRIYFKYTGSNIFGTITNSLGEVLFSYSAGIFKNTRTRKEKTTIFIAKQLGELIALRLYKSNASEIVFIPFMNHRKARLLMRFLSSGFRLIRFFRLSKFIVTRRVMRNGVRLRKIARK